MLLLKSADQTDRTSRRVDGIILAGVSDNGEEVSRYLRMNRVAAVMIGRFIGEEFDQVGVENVRATAQLVLHLDSHGHQHIGFIAGKTGLATSTERLEGFLDGISEAVSNGTQPGPCIGAQSGPLSGRLVPVIHRREVPVAYRCKPGTRSGPVLEPPALVAGLDDLTVMRQSVKQGRGHLGVTDHLMMPRKSTGESLTCGSLILGMPFMGAVSRSAIVALAAVRPSSWFGFRMGGSGR